MRCQVRHAARDGGRGAALTIIATSDVMCAGRQQLRLVMAWAGLSRRRLVTSVMVMPIIFMHRVRGVIMMMVMRHNMINMSLGSMLTKMLAFLQSALVSTAVSWVEEGVPVGSMSDGCGSFGRISPHRVLRKPT